MNITKIEAQEYSSPPPQIKEYRELVGLYLTGVLNPEDFKSKLTETVNLTVHPNNLRDQIAGKQSIIIANHPLWPELAVPVSELPQQVKEESRDPQIFGSPFVKHLLVAKLLNGIPFRSLMQPIGYRKYMEQFNCLELPSSGGIDFAVQFLRRNPDTSLFMHPEGWFNSLKPGNFQTGFLRIAEAANINTIVLVALSNKIGLSGVNRAEVVEITKAPFNAELRDVQSDMLHKWIDKQREKILQYKKEQGF